MAFSLYDATIPTFIQILGATCGLIDKAEAHCAEKGVSETDLLNAHFGEDMLPLSWQLKWVSTHSIGAIESVRKGGFSPDREPPTENLAGFRAQIGSSIAALKEITPEEMEGFVGQDMVFTIGNKLRMDFLAEHFLMSLSLPNFMFHATTAYDLLRHQGVVIGKLDFLGTPRLKVPATA
ncbi:MAG: DUF1993 domain-containing protein [Sphingobium sp.]|nr:DUF1993 domain-containing protein [Sphingobium sp.]MCP5399495.1 DUF1993 domain-containing protein [Sphingomonas sp.]